MEYELKRRIIQISFGNLKVYTIDVVWVYWIFNS